MPTRPLWSLGLVALTLVPAPAAGQAHRWLETTALPALAASGVAGACAGTSNGAMLVAGGTSFPDTPPWQGGERRWHDAVHVLAPGEAEWSATAEILATPFAYGASVTVADLVLCIGGADASGHRREVVGLRWTGSAVEVVPLPPLPAPSAYLAAAAIGPTVFAAGGLASADAPEALRRFWQLDLSAPDADREWMDVAPWPGPERHLAVAGVQDGAFYLFSGIRLEAGRDGGPRRRLPYLRDGYRFDPAADERGRWTRTADLPRAAAAAPSPLPAPGQSHLVILGGLSGSLVDVAPAEHPGFLESALVYHTITDTWLVEPTVSVRPSRVVAPVVPLAGGWAVVGGETRPGIRTADVTLARTAAEADRFGTIDWIVVGAYMAALLVLGLYFSRRGETTNDFFLAGHRVPWWAAGLSIFGTQLSALSFMAVPAVAYSTDWVRMSGTWSIVLVAAVVVVFFLPFFRRLDVSTAYEYLERRFGLGVRLFGATMFVLFQVGRIGIVLYLPAIALAAVTGLDVVACIVVMGACATAYTVLGGIEAVIWTDVMQVVVLTASAVWCLAVVVVDVGGVGPLVQAAAAHEKLRVLDWRWDPTAMVVWVMALGATFTNLVPYTTDQSVIQRYLTTRDEQAAARSIWTNAAISVPASVLFFGLGTALYVYYRSHPEWITAGRHDEILPRFMVQQLPAGLAGLGIAGIFAASMSSLDSSMNSVATSVVNDFVRRFRPAVADSTYLALAKLITLMMGSIGIGTAVVMASRDDIRFAADYFNGLMGLLGGGLAGVFLLAVFTRRASSRGALTGAVVGAAAPLVAQQTTDLNFFLYAPIGVTSCVTVGYLVSLALPDPDRDLRNLTWSTLDPDSPDPPSDTRADRSSARSPTGP